MDDLPPPPSYASLFPSSGEPTAKDKCTIETAVPNIDSGNKPPSPSYESLFPVPAAANEKANTTMRETSAASVESAIVEEADPRTTENSASSVDVAIIDTREAESTPGLSGQYSTDRDSYPPKGPKQPPSPPEAAPASLSPSIELDLDESDVAELERAMALMNAAEKHLVQPRHKGAPRKARGAA